MERIVIVGTSGSGKSTLGAHIAARLGYRHVELDALYWERDWHNAEISIFRQRVTQALQAPGWVVDGNYSKVRDIVWGMSDTLIWLDYPFMLNLWRVVRRTYQRVVTQENLWGSGSYESWRTTFGRHSIIWWMVKTYRKHKAEYPRLLAQPEYAHLDVLHFTHPQQTEAWLQALPLQSANQG